MRRTLDGHEFEPFGPDTSQKVIDAARDLGLDACQADDALRPHVATGIARAAEDAWKLGEPVQRACGDVAGALDEWEPGQLKLGRRILVHPRDAGRRSLFGGTWQIGESLPFGLREAGDSAML
jgi:hypothetical protein